MMPDTATSNALFEQLRRAQAARAEAEGERDRLRALILQAPALIALLRGPELRLELVHPGIFGYLGAASCWEGRCATRSPSWSGKG